MDSRLPMPMKASAGSGSIIALSRGDCATLRQVTWQNLRHQCLDSRWLQGFPSRPDSRERLEKSLDAVFTETIDPSIHLDAVEGKLFGIGSESYVVGSLTLFKDE